MSSPMADRSPDGWDEHWHAYADSAADNPAQALRRRLIFDRLRLGAARAPARLLEVGSGQGDFARDLAATWPGVSLLGLDLSERGCEMARAKAPAHTFIACDVTRPLSLPESFRGWATHAVCSEVLEHVDDPALILANIRPYLAPGARLVVTVPAGPMSAFDRHIGHRRHFTRQALGDILLTAGYGVAEVSGAGFPFFNLYRLVVIARGEKLIKEVEVGPGEGRRRLPWSARTAMRAFGILFQVSRARGHAGWQLVAEAVVPTGVPPTPRGP